MHHEHYFYVQSVAPDYVAFIAPTEPKEGELHPLGIEIGRVKIVAMQNPAMLKKWINMMSEASNASVQLFFATKGVKVGEVEVESILSKVPEVH